MQDFRNLVISVIGGGGVYPPELVDYLAQNSCILGDMEVRLMDIDDERLGIVGGLCERIVQKRKANINVSYCKTYKDAVTGADFVLIQFRVGGEDSRISDEKLGQKYGLPFVETVGICGFSTFLRTYCEVEKLVRIIVSNAPDAWVINFTNPAGMISEAINKLGIEKVVGVCNSSLTFLEYVKKKLGVDNIFMNWRGLNHFTFVDKIMVNGENLFGKFVEFVDDNDVPCPFSKELIQTLGFIPNYYLQYYFFQKEVSKKQQKLKKVRSEIVKEVNRELLELYRRIDYIPDGLKKRGGYGYSKVVVELIKGMVTGDHSIHYAVVKNEKTLLEIPDDGFVEVPIVTIKNGFRTIQVEPLPNSVRGIVMNMKTYEQMLINGLRSRKRELLLTALLIHPFIGDWKLANNILSDVLMENSRYMQGF